MRTTLKRGVGRGAAIKPSANGAANGRAIYPPGAISQVTRYRQPPPSTRTGLQLVGRILFLTLLVATSLGLGVAGGAYLYFHESVADVQAKSADVKRAAIVLDIPKANEPAIALVLGYDHRAGVESQNPSLSDTLMLIRADPQTQSISLLSFPRDLDVPIYCDPSAPRTTDRINSAYTRCGSKGTVLTVQKLTGLPINYLITVNFHGFKQVVDKLDGVWMDVDRRYYNRNTGSSLNNYANIDLQPGYQKLTGQQALDFVRFRHTDSDLFRTARQQSFVRAFREQVRANFSPLNVPGLVKTITSNIEVAEGGHRLQGKQVASYALFAYGLPSGHFFQDRIENVVCGLGCTASSDEIEKAVRSFSTPDVESSKVANAAALGVAVKRKAPPPASVTLTVLNGSGVAGVAADTSYALGQRGYKVLPPPNDLQADAPRQDYFHSMIYYDPAQPRSKLAATALQNLIQPADVAKLPASPRLRTLNPGSMLLVVLGTAFHGSLGQTAETAAPKHQPAYVRSDASVARALLEPVARKFKFPLLNPTILERSSSPDTSPGDKPIRRYFVEGRHKALRLVFRTGSNEYWGVQETDWDDAPALADKSFRHSLGGREFDFYYNGSKLHMVVLRQQGASYWVVNTLLDSLSNETMIAIAKGLKPLTSGK
jgi:LCP family protein required for cell wall assembly